MIAEKYGRLAEGTLFTIQTQGLYDASLEGVPHFVYTDHTHLANLQYPGTRPEHLASPRWIRLEKEIYQKARMNLVMSRFIRTSLIEDYECEPDQIAIVGAASNMPEPREPLQNDGYGNKTILFVGIDWARKGGPLLLEAFKKVQAAVPDARLIIAGASPEVAMPNVEVVGRVPLEEVSRLLQRAAVATLPSFREPQGVIVIEAQLHGLPVVASDIGALPEMVADGRTGKIVPVGDRDALAAALTELITNPALCRSYGEAGRARAREFYSDEAVKRKIAAAIRVSIGENDLPEAARESRAKYAKYAKGEN